MVADKDMEEAVAYIKEVEVQEKSMKFVRKRAAALSQRVLRILPPRLQMVAIRSDYRGSPFHRNGDGPRA